METKPDRINILTKLLFFFKTAAGGKRKQYIINLTSSELLNLESLMKDSPLRSLGQILGLSYRLVNQDLFLASRKINPGKRGYIDPDGHHICYKCSEKIHKITVDCAECAEEVYYPPNRLLICKVCYEKTKDNSSVLYNCQKLSSLHTIGGNFICDNCKNAYYIDGRKTKATLVIAFFHYHKHSSNLPNFGAYYDNFLLKSIIYNLEVATQKEKEDLEKRKKEDLKKARTKAAKEKEDLKKLKQKEKKDLKKLKQKK